MKIASPLRRPHDRAKSHFGLFLGQMLQRPGRIAAVSPWSVG